MTTDSNCCCMHVKTCATLVAIIGIIWSILQIFAVFLLWWYVPMSIILLITYIFVLVGVSKQLPGFLLPAEIILGINLAISILIIVGLIIVGAILPEGIVESYNNNGRTLDEARTVVRIAFFVSAFIVLLASSYTIFSFIVIHKARKWISENEGTSYRAP
uniref:Uncharacterized protein n=1 Tax=Panagrolaimus sp. ES5 TaxID=591445 RepID=A0AC34G2V8_9BILA